MASDKNSGRESLGFKTATFGFDKNDVNAYISGLRKKIKTIEEEYAKKLEELEEQYKQGASAPQNSAFSEQLAKKDAEIDRLNNKITAAKEENESLARKLNAAAEEIRLLKNKSVPEISGKINDASQINLLVGEIIGAAENVRRLLGQDTPATELAEDDSLREFNFVEEPKPVEENKPTVTIKPTVKADSDLLSEFGDLLTDDSPIVEVEPEKPSAIDELKVEGDELLSLLADDEPQEDIIIEQPPEVVDKGEDLSADLYEILIEPENEQKHDLGEMLEQKEKEDLELFSKFVVTESNPSEVISVAAEIKPANDLAADFSFVASDEIQPIGEKKETPSKRVENVFDIAFNSDEEDDDDMSTEADTFIL